MALATTVNTTIFPSALGGWQSRSTDIRRGGASYVVNTAWSARSCAYVTTTFDAPLFEDARAVWVELPHNYTTQAETAAANHNKAVERVLRLLDQDA